MTYSIDMTPNDPVFESASIRLIKKVKEHKKFLDAIIACSREKRDGNWIFKKVKEHRDFVYLKAKLLSDAKFKAYIEADLKKQFGSDYARRLIEVFSE